MTLQFIQVETVRQAALTLLRDAIAAANAEGAPASPLKGLKVPEHRFVVYQADEAPWLHVVAKSDGGAGAQHSTPLIDGSAVLHLNLFTAAGRKDAKDLDAQAVAIAEAVCLLLMETSEFLELFDWVEALKVEFIDAETEDREYDVVAVQIALEVKMTKVFFHPKADDELDLAEFKVTTEHAPGAAVVSDIPVAQE